MEDDMTKLFAAGVLAGGETFRVLVDKTGGDLAKMIFALSSILSSIETTNPGTIDDVTEGAFLLFDRHMVNAEYIPETVVN